MVAKITVQQLRNGGACSGAIEEFVRLFGQEAEITDENSDKFNRAYVGWGGYAYRFFESEEFLGKYEDAVKDIEHDGEVQDCPRCKAERSAFVKFYTEEYEAKNRTGDVSESAIGSAEASSTETASVQSASAKPSDW